MAGETTGWGTDFKLHNGADPGALVALEGVFEISAPSEEADDVEITHFKSPARRREYIRGLIETGEIEVQMNYVPGSATDTLCRAALAAGDNRAFELVLPDEAGDPAWEITGTAYAKSYERAIPLEDKLSATLTLKVTGATSEGAAS